MSQLRAHATERSARWPYPLSCLFINASGRRKRRTFRVAFGTDRPSVGREQKVLEKIVLRCKPVGSGSITLDQTTVPSFVVGDRPHAQMLLAGRGKAWGTPLRWGSSFGLGKKPSPFRRTARHRDQRGVLKVVKKGNAPPGCREDYNPTAIVSARMFLPPEIRCCSLRPETTGSIPLTLSLFLMCFESPLFDSTLFRLRVRSSPTPALSFPIPLP